jgi:hypothetical protein
MYLGDDEDYDGRFWRAIAASGLDDKDFEAGPSEIRGYEWRLFHKPTKWALHASAAFGSNQDVVDVLRTQPGSDPVDLGEAEAEDYITIVRDWAKELKTAKIDERRRAVPLPPGPDDGQSENTPFTPTEQVQIINELRNVRNSVRNNYKLSAKQLTAIDKRLIEAEEASKRLGRKDWKSLFYGAVFGLMVNDAIPPDVAQHIFTGVVHGIAHMFGGSMPPGPWMLGQ